MASKSNRLVHSRRGLVSKRREWEAVGSLKSVGSFRKVMTGAVPVFFVAFFAAFMAASIFTPVKTSDAANTVTANIQSNGYYVRVNSSDVDLDLLTTPSGAMTVASSTVKASTNSPGGYKLYLGMASTKSDGTAKTPAEQALNGLYLDEDLSSSDVIAAVSADATAPAALTDNTWGYAIDKNAVGAPAIWTTADHSTMESATPTSDVFAAVPAVGSEELIQTTNSANSSISEEDWSDDYFDDATKYTSTTVYYGVRGTMAMTSGAYSNTIAYTAVTQASPSPSGEMSFSPAAYARDSRYESMTWDDTLTITTSLLTATTMDPGTATVTLSGGPLGQTNISCPVTNVSVVPAAAGLTSGYVTIQCTLPQAYAATYDIVVNLPKFGVSYNSTYEYTVDWTTISAMQEMSSSVCQSAGNVTASQVTKSNPVPEVFLTDLRGGGGHITGSLDTGYGTSADYTGKYRIRKLADGNCWMTENMDLPQSTTQVYHPYDSNVTANWSPSSNYITAAGQTDTTVTNDHTYQGNGSAGSKTVVTTDTTGTTGLPQETQYIGTYYNWAAAIASRTAIASGDATQSVCPKGWRLPSGGDASTKKSFAALMSAYSLSNDATGSTNARRYPLSFVFSGRYYWYNGQLYYQGANGVWWSTSATASDTARYLSMNATLLNPQGNNSKLLGFTLRCVSL